jgi:tRNA uridine 5-carboxymethylaminomethyl modification enzyme
LEQILKRPEISYNDLPHKDDSLSKEVRLQVEIAVKYAGYIGRQEVEVKKLKSLEEKEIPQDFDYDALAGLRTEARIKLKQIRPKTIGQASRISGVSPADISLVMVWLKRGSLSTLEGADCCAAAADAE